MRNADRNAKPDGRKASEEGHVVRLCYSCRKEMAEVGGLCLDCDHLLGDIMLDRAGLITNRRTT